MRARFPVRPLRPSLAARWRSDATGPTAGLWDVLAVADAFGTRNVEDVHDLADKGLLPFVEIDGARWFDPELVRNLIRSAALRGFGIPQALSIPALIARLTQEHLR